MPVYLDLASATVSFTYNLEINSRNDGGLIFPFNIFIRHTRCSLLPLIEDIDNEISRAIRFFGNFSVLVSRKSSSRGFEIGIASQEVARS